MVQVEDVFSVIALFILFRETIEASIIVGVLMQFLSRSKPLLMRAAWWAVAAGVGGSIIFGVIFVVLFYVAKDNLFQGKNRDIFKGCISWIAAILITILGFAMLRFLGWEQKWKRRLEASAAEAVAKAAADAAAREAEATAAGPQDSERKDVVSTPSLAQPAAPVATVALTTHDSANVKEKLLQDDDRASPKAVLPAGADEAAVAELMKDVEAAEPGPDMTPPTRKEWWSIWLLVFTTVIREGIESVVFLGGVGNTKPSGIPLAGFVGILSGVLVGMFLFWSGRQVKDLKWLVIGMGVVIFFIAAGQVSIGTDSMIRAGMFGYCSPWLDERPWTMVPLWDISKCCSDLDANNKFFALVRAIFGYQDKPTFIEILFYCGFWIVVVSVGFYKWKQGSLFDADFKYKKQQAKLEAERLEAERLAEEQALSGIKVGGVELTEYDSSSIDSKPKEDAKVSSDSSPSSSQEHPLAQRKKVDQ